MKKMIIAVTSAVIFSCAMGAASAYEYSQKAKTTVKSASCNCKDCSCDNCSCTDCSDNCTCDNNCCADNSGCGGACCKK